MNKKKRILPPGIVDMIIADASIILWDYNTLG